MAFEQLKERLDREGLFDPAHKRPLPPLPRRIGIVTSKNGAALQDVRNILSHRYPIGELLLIPALVQGEGAPESICAGIAQAQTAGWICSSSGGAAALWRICGLSTMRGWPGQFMPLESR